MNIWKTYKKGVLVCTALATLIFLAITAAGNLARQTILTGTTVNVRLSEAGSDFLKEAVRTRSAEHGDIHFAEAELAPFTSVQDLNGANYQAFQGLMTLYTTQELDFMLLDQAAMEIFLRQGICMDLRSFLSQEELDALADAIIYNQPSETAEPIPEAVNISALPFAQANISCEGDVYFIVADNALHLENCRFLWNVIYNWEADP